jgi:HK97 family phage major capsid protein
MAGLEVTESVREDVVIKETAALDAIRLHKLKGGKSSAHLRSITKAAAGDDVGMVEVVNDVVRQYDEACPIFAAHKKIQRRNTGNAYVYTRITRGDVGHDRTEAVASADDATSAMVMVTQAFKNYTGDTVIISEEMVNDAGFDLSAEVLALGLGKTVPLLAADLVAALKSAFLVSSTFTPTETAGTSWDIQDLINAYFEIPARNRSGISYVCNSATAKLLIEMLSAENSEKAMMIRLMSFGADGVSPAIVEDAAVPDGVVFVANVTKALAIGMGSPVRVKAMEVSEGTKFEVQPRFAVGLRDGTALAVRKLKTA